MRHLEGVAALPEPTASLGSPRRFALAYPRHAPRGRHDLGMGPSASYSSRPPPTCCQLKRAGPFCGASSPSLRGRGDFSDFDVEQVVRAALLDQSAARGCLRTTLRVVRTHFPVERWRVKTASPLVGSAVLRLAQQLRHSAKLAAMRRASSRVRRCAPQMRLLKAW